MIPAAILLASASADTGRPSPAMVASIERKLSENRLRTPSVWMVAALCFLTPRHRRRPFRRRALYPGRPCWPSGRAFHHQARTARAWRRAICFGLCPIWDRDRPFYANLLRHEPPGQEGPL